MTTLSLVYYFALKNGLVPVEMIIRGAQERLWTASDKISDHAMACSVGDVVRHDRGHSAVATRPAKSILVTLSWRNVYSNRSPEMGSADSSGPICSGSFSSFTS